MFRLVISDKTTRNLFFFLLLNFVFAFVELFYGLWTNSLGLISDSFHMFFDCSALLLGLAASIVTKWRSTSKFTYGFGRAEVLAGMANGLFLLFIALFIMKEAIERAFEPPEVHHERLFVISVLGFLVNLVGIFVFQHGGQTHHGCSHSHSHSHNDHHHHQHHNHTHLDNHHDHASHQPHNHNHGNHQTIAVSTTNHSQHHHKTGYGEGRVSLDMNGLSATNAYEHFHDPFSNNNNIEKTKDSDYLLPSNVNLSHEKVGNRGQIIQSVFLHIVADTLGSVGVIISAVLMNQFGWMIADPLCSLFIAILISISVYPLLRDAFYILMQRVPVELEDKIPQCLQRLETLSGVQSVHEAHFWTLKSDTYIGNVKLEISQGADYKYVLASSKNIFESVGIDKINIQIEQA